MTPDQYRAFIKQVLPPLGYQWRRFDRKNTRRKVRRRMEQLGIHDPAAYARLLSGNPDETRHFESLLAVTTTRFFRNAWLWSDLRDLLSGGGHGFYGRFSGLKVWSAGCAGGEETFTAAMLLDDVAGSSTLGSPWTVLGTDIDLPSLARSRNAVYGWGAVREVPARIRERWFSRENDTWILDRRILDMVEIRHHHVVREDPPGSFQIVLLRNSVLTYNTEEIQRECLKKIRGCLLEPGLLVIGRTEKVPEGTGFEEIGRCIYKKEEGRM